MLALLQRVPQGTDKAPMTSQLHGLPEPAGVAPPHTGPAELREPACGARNELGNQRVQRSSQERQGRTWRERWREHQSPLWRLGPQPPLTSHHSPTAAAGLPAPLGVFKQG